MPAPFSDDNLKSAFFKSLAHTGLSVFVTEGEKHLPDKVLVTIPSEMQNEFPQNLLNSVMFICEVDPYSWQVDEKLPDIKDETIYMDLFNKWFKKILSSAEL